MVIRNIDDCGFTVNSYSTTYFTKYTQNGTVNPNISVSNKNQGTGISPIDRSRLAGDDGMHHSSHKILRNEKNALTVNEKRENGLTVAKYLIN